MSTKTKNAESKVVAETQVSTAQGGVPPAAVVAAKAAQDKVQKALTPAELAKKKLEEEAQAEADAKLAAAASESVESEEEVAAASASPAVENTSEEGEALAEADEAALEDIEAVAKQLDETAAGLDLASQDLGMMLAQASSSGAAPVLGTIGGINTGAVVAGVVVIGAVAASGGSSSGGTAAAATTTSAGGLVSYLGLDLNTFISAPSAIAAATISGPTAASAISTIATRFTSPLNAVGTSVTPTWTSKVSGSDNLFFNSVTGTSADDNIILTSAKMAVGTGGGFDVNSDYYVGTVVNGGAGDDVLRLAIDTAATASITGTTEGAANTPNNLTLTGVESVQVITNNNVSVNTAKFSGVEELWNWGANTGSNKNVSFTSVGSTDTVIGVYGSSGDTFVTYADTATGGKTISVVAHNAASGATVSLDTSAISDLGVNALKVSSNGTANTVNFVDTAASIKSVTVVGSATMNLQMDQSTLAGVTSVNASGMTGNVNVTMGNLSAVGYTTEGGAGTNNTVTATVDASAALNVTRFKTANLGLNHAAANVTVDLAKSSGVGTVALTETGATTGNTSLANMAKGTAVSVSAASGAFGIGTLSVDFAELSDAAIALTGGAAGTTITSISTSDAQTINLSASGVGTKTVTGLTVDSDARAINITNTGSAQLGVGGVTASAVTDSLILDVTTSTSGGVIDLSGSVQSRGDLYLKATATTAAITGAANAFSQDGTLTAVVTANSANATVGNLNSDDRASLYITANATPTAGFTAAAGNIQSVTGDVAVVAKASASASGKAFADIGNITSDQGSVSYSGTAERNGRLDVGALNAAESAFLSIKAGDGALLDTGTITAANNVIVGVSLGAGNTASDVGAITSSDGDISIAASVSSTDANVSDLTFASVTATRGQIAIGSIDFKSAQIGNSGVVNTSVGDSGVLIFGDLTATNSLSGSVTIGTKAAKVSIGDEAALEIGNIASYKSFSLSTANNLSLTNDSQLEIASINVVAGDATVNLDLSNLIGTDVTLGKSGGSFLNRVLASGVVDIDVNGGIESSIVIGRVQSGAAAVVANGEISTYSVDLDLVVGQNLAGGDTGRITVGNIDATNTGGAVSVNALAGGNADISIAGGTAQFIDARSDIDITVATGVETTNSVGANRIRSTEGDVSLMATVNSAATQTSSLTIAAITANTGNVSLDSRSTVAQGGTLTLTSVSATGHNATVSLGTQASAVKIAAGGTLSVGDVTANGAINVAAELSTGAVLVGGGDLTSTTGTVSVDILGGATGISLVAGNVDANGAVSIEFVGGDGVGLAGQPSPTTVELGTVVSRNSSVLLDLTSGRNTDVELAEAGISGNAAVGSTAVDLRIDVGAASDVDNSANNGSGFDINAASGNIALVVNTDDNTGAGATVVDLKAISATLGNITFSAASELGSATTVDIVSFAANGQGGTVTIGNSEADGISLRNGASLDVGAINADSNILITVNQASESTLAADAIDSASGNVDIVATGGAFSTDLDLNGNIVANKDVYVKFVGGSAAVVDVQGDITAETGHVNLDLQVGNVNGSSGKINVNGDITAVLSSTAGVTGLGTVTIGATAGASANIDIAASGNIEADEGVNITLAIGSGTAGNQIANGTTGIKAKDGNVTINATVTSSTNTPSTLVFGNVESNEGHVQVQTLDIGQRGTVTFGKVEADSARVTPVVNPGIYFGAAGDAIDLQAQATLNVGASTGISAHSDIKFYINAEAKTSIDLAASKSIISNNGQLVIDVAGNADGVTFKAAGTNGIQAEGDVTVDVLVDDNAIVEIGKTGNVTSYNGDVDIRVIAGDSDAAKKALEIGDVYASGGDGSVKLDLSLGNKSIADIGKVTSSGNIDIDLTTGEGIGDATSGNYAVGDIVSDDGNVDFRFVVNSNNQTGSQAGTKLGLGKVTADNGSISFESQSFVGSDGQVVAGNIAAGDNLSIGGGGSFVNGRLSSESIEVEAGDLSLLQFGNLITQRGNIDIGVDLGDAADLTIGKVTSYVGDIAIRVDGASYEFIGTSGAAQGNGTITIGNVDAQMGDATLDIRSTEQQAILANSSSSIATIAKFEAPTGTATVHFVGANDINPGPVTTAVGDLTISAVNASSFVARLGGSADVTFSSVAAAVTNVNAGTGNTLGYGLTATSTSTFTTAATANTFVGGAGVDTVTYNATVGSVNFTGNGSNDVLTVAGGVGMTVTINDLSGSDSITVSNAGTDIFATVRAGATYNAAATFDHASSKGDVFITGMTGSTIYRTGDSHAFTFIAGGNTTVYGGDAADEFRALTADMTVYNLGDNAAVTETLKVGSARTLTATLGSTAGDHFTAANDSTNLGTINIYAYTGIAGNVDINDLANSGTVNIYGNSGGDKFTSDSGIVNMYGDVDGTSTGADKFIVAGGTATAYGYDSTDSFTLSGGSMTAYGGDGIDTFTVSAGTMTATGGDGADVYVISGGTLNITDLRSKDGATAAVDRITASGGAISATTTGFVADANTGNTGTVANFVVTLSGSGNLDMSAATGNGYTLNGSASADIISGGVGDDVISGGLGNDVLRGGAGDDELFGGGNNDTLIGGAGADELTGGSGNDTFVFANLANVKSTVDTIKDFAAGDAVAIQATAGGEFADLHNGAGASFTGGLAGNVLDVGIAGNTTADAADNVFAFSSGIANGLTGINTALGGTKIVKKSDGTNFAAGDELLVVVENSSTGHVEVGIVTIVGADGFNGTGETYEHLGTFETSLNATQLAATINFIA